MPPKGVKLAPPPAPPSPSSAAAQQQKANAFNINDYELPKTSLTKLAKGSIPDNVKMQQDVVLALMRGSTLFISYLSAAAHDQALARSGKSITAADVLKAITELDFGPADNLIPLLETELSAYRKHVAANKASKKPGPGRGKGPRKSKGGAIEGGEGDGDISMMGEDGVDDGEDDEVEDIDDEEEDIMPDNGHQR